MSDQHADLAPEADAVSLVRAFEDGTLPKPRWTHTAHLTVGLWYVLTLGTADAMRTLRSNIRRYNSVVGTPNSDSEGYHETITRLYVDAIADLVAAAGETRDFSTLLDALLRSPVAARDYPLRFYSRERLFSAEARRAWVDPDLLG